MPVRPEREALYPGGSLRSPEWLAIRKAIKLRAGNACEGSPAYPDCRAKNGRPHPVTGATVVCTVAHVDHDETNSDPANLRFWCQRCHNTHDAANRRRNARARFAVADLFGTAELRPTPIARPEPPPAASELPIARLARERAALTKRALRLPRRSLTRQAIELELARLTARQLALELRGRR